MFFFSGRCFVFILWAGSHVTLSISQLPIASGSAALIRMNLGRICLSCLTTKQQSTKNARKVASKRGVANDERMI
jgi:hypothetical protein